MNYIISVFAGFCTSIIVNLNSLRYRDRLCKIERYKIILEDYLLLLAPCFLKSMIVST